MSRGNTRLSATLVLLGLLVCAVLAATYATPAAAQKSFECQDVWTGPSKNNDVLTCLSNSDRLKHNVRFYIFPGFAALIFILILLIFPICCCSYCCKCCCGSCCLPKTNMSFKRAKCCLWVWTAVSIVMAVGVFVCIIVGSHELIASVNEIMDNRTNETDAFVETRISLIKSYTKEATAKAGVEIDLDSLESSKKQIIDLLRTVEDYTVKYSKIAGIVSYCIGSVAFVLMLLVLMCACCKCNGCPAIGCGCLYYFLGIIFALLAILFTVMAYFIAGACGEIDLQLSRQPGIFQWYLVPVCEDAADFSTLRGTLNQQVASVCESSCTELLKYCTPDESYTTGSEQVFVCGDNMHVAGDCDSLDKLAVVIQETKVKATLKNTFCTDTSGWEYNYDCTIPRCATDCTNYASLKPKDRAQEMLGYAQMAIDVSVALAIADPLMDCNYLIDHVINEAFVNRYSLRAATYITASGYFVGAILFALLMHVALRGSQMWVESFDSIVEEEKDQDEKDIEMKEKKE